MSGAAKLRDAASGAEHDVQLGARIRLLRRQRNLSVQALAHEAGVSPAMISQIERGLSTPSLRSLRQLSSVLGVPMSWFFEVTERGGARNSNYVVRGAHRRLLRLTQTGVMKQLLSPETDGRMMEMYELTLEIGGSSGGDFHYARGEKAGVVLAGILRLWLDEEAIILRPGDSFQFPSTVPHRFDNPASEPTRVLWINTPPMPWPKPAPGKASTSG